MNNYESRSFPVDAFLDQAPVHQQCLADVGHQDRGEHEHDGEAGEEQAGAGQHPTPDRPGGGGPGGDGDSR